MIDTTDFYARLDNPLTRADPRIKLIFSLLAILLCIIFSYPVIPLAAAALIFLSLMAIHIPLTYLCKRLAAPILMALTAFLLKLFLTPGRPLISISIAGLHLTGSDAGLESGMLIMAKVIGAVSILVFLGLTTRLDHIAWAAGRLRIPHLLVEMLLLVYRYVFLLMEESAAIRRAQQSRLGYTDWKTGFKSLATLLGMLFIRIFDRSEAIHWAMISRGYRGRYHIDRAGSASLLHILAAAMILVGLVLAGIFTG